jgi:hypothetical protein
MCESVFKTAGEQQGNCMGTAWERHGMCESALSVRCGCYVGHQAENETADAAVSGTRRHKLSGSPATSAVPA